MRITGGIARGIPLRTAKESEVRPATDRLREAVFSSLGPRIREARFLDLFAGSGAYGLEAWSRGAKNGIFVEKSRASIRSLNENLTAVARSLGADAKNLQVVQADVLRWKSETPAGADLIFVDPPYHKIENLARELFPKLADWLAPEGIVVFEMPGEIELQLDEWVCIRRLGKGKHQPTCCLFERIDRAD